MAIRECFDRKYKTPKNNIDKYYLEFNKNFQITENELQAIEPGSICDRAEFGR
jgi:hypothetical protein